MRIDSRLSPGIGNRELSTKKRKARKLSPAGCPVDCLGLTEVVTLVAPRAFRCRAQRVSGGSDFINQPILTDCLRENVPDFPDQRFLENSA
jgi:hypothetical protein